MTKKTFAFLYATRFWALFIGALTAYFKAEGWIDAPLATFIETVCIGFITVRTVDRATEQPIIAAAVVSGQVDAKALIDIPPAKADTMTTTIKTK